MQYSQEHLKTMVYAKFGGQTECIMGNWKIENSVVKIAEKVLSSRTWYSNRKNANISRLYLP